MAVTWAMVAADRRARVAEAQAEADAAQREWEAAWNVNLPDAAEGGSLSIRADRAWRRVARLRLTLERAERLAAEEASAP